MADIKMEGQNSPEEGKTQGKKKRVTEESGGRKGMALND